MQPARARERQFRGLQAQGGGAGGGGGWLGSGTEGGRAEGQGAQTGSFEMCYARAIHGRHDLLFGLLLHSVPPLVCCCQLLLQACAGPLSFLLEPVYANSPGVKP